MEQNNSYNKNEREEERKYLQQLLNNYSFLDKKKKNNKKMQYGGNNSDSIDGPNVLDGPDGGFPPIYICDSNDIDNENKNREYVKHKNAISIKKIMEKRRNITPINIV